jgi:ATP-binding cassette subfamily G (WHITE) protein 2 (PDR)
MASEQSERPVLEQHASSSDRFGMASIDSAEDENLRREPTNTTIREREFEPICPGDRAELTRIATTIGRTISLKPSHPGDIDLQRVDTLAGISIGDAVLDPQSPEFDVYKWARM